MKLLLLLLVGIPLCLANHVITESLCMNDGPRNFLTGQSLFDTTLVDGESLLVCSYDESTQCCTQADEDQLGSVLNQALRYNLTLGSGLESARSFLSMLATDIATIAEQVRDNILRQLMMTSISRVTEAARDLLDGEVNMTLTEYDSFVLQDVSTVNLVTVFTKFLRDGVSASVFETLGVPPADKGCAVPIINTFLFSNVGAQINQFGTTLQEIGEALRVIRQANSSIEQLLEKIASFNVSSSCVDVWTRQYACPLCIAQNEPLCIDRCNEVLIGCFSPLRQAIVQMNSLLSFTSKITTNLLELPGNITDRIAISRLVPLYKAMFGDISDTFSTDLLAPIEAACPVRRKRSDDSLPRMRRAGGGGSFDSTPLDSAVVNRIKVTELPMLVSVIPSDISTDRNRLCAILRANGTSSCTIGIENVTDSYTSAFVASSKLDVSKQGMNPSGDFDAAQLINQAKTLPYVISDLLTTAGAAALFSDVLPGVTPPDTKFLSSTPNFTPTESPTNPGGGAAATIASSIVLTVLAVTMATLL